AEESRLRTQRVHAKPRAGDQLDEAHFGEPVAVGRPTWAMEEGHRDHRAAAVDEDSRALPHRGLGCDDVLEHLDADDPVDARVVERQGLRVGHDVGALARLEIQADPAPRPSQRRLPAPAGDPLGADLEDDAREPAGETLQLGVEQRAAIAEPERPHQRPGRASRLRSSISSATRRVKSYRSTARALARSPSSRARAGSSRTRANATASAPGSRRSNRSPVTSCSMIARLPPTSEAMHGTPALIASSRILGCPSVYEGRTNASAAV